jgi:protein-S-isoprenylcysteine O-methyltransferase Ste14
MSTVASAWAWLGGAIFAASLGICAWWYFVTLGRVQPAADLDASQLIVNGLLVAVFAMHHSVFARESIKRRLSGIPEHMRRTVYVWVASVLLIVVIALWQPVGGDLYEASGGRALLHVAVQALGLWLIARAAAGLDPFELAGIRDATRQPHRDSLEVNGPYRFVRHPLYLGWLLLFFGIPHMTGDRLAFAALTSLYLVIAIPFEERSLVRCFGDDYRRYRARVRWRLVPFIY